MRRFLLPTLILAISSMALAQKTSLTVDEVVAHVRENVATYRSLIPNFSAEEAVDSQRLDGVKVKDEMTIQSSFRMTRTKPDEMEESRTITTVNGKPAKSQKVSPSFSFRGGFAEVPQMIRNTCLDFRFGPSGPYGPDGNIVLISVSKPKDGAKCNAPQSEGEMIIDPATFQVIRIEHTYHDMHFNASVMAHLLLATTPSDHNIFREIVTFASVAIGDKTFWLPKVVEVKVSDTVKPISLRYEATYTNYHRFTATSTIIPTEPQIIPQ